jgi:hypothetical protein
MSARFEAILGVFPRWKTTPELADLVERSLAHYSPDQVKYAAGQQRLERKSDDPDIGGLKNRLAGTRHVQTGNQYHVAGKAQADEYNNRPNTPEEDRWDQLCDSWRADLKQAKAAPGFTPDGWARTAYPLFRRDIAEFGHTSKTFATAYLVRIAHQCGVKLQPKGGNPDAIALVKLTVGAA